MGYNKKSMLVDLFFFSLVLFTAVAPKFYFFKGHHLWVFIVGLWGLTSLFTLKKQSYTRTYIDLFFTCLMGYLFVRFFINRSEFTLYKSDRFLELLGYIVFYIKTKKLVVILKKEHKIHWVVYPFLMLCVGQAILAVLQYTGKAESTNEFFKLTGTLHSPNYVGLLLSLGVIGIVWLLMHKKQLAKWHKIVLGVLGLFLVGLIGLSTSRTSWMVLFIGITLLSFSTQSFRNYIKKLSKTSKISYATLLTFLVLGGGYYLYHFKKDSADGRFLINKITSTEIAKQPLLGHGLFSFEKGYNTTKTTYFTTTKQPWEQVRLGNYVYNAFNDYLYFGYELGIVLPISLLLLLIFIVYYSQKTTYFLLGISLLIGLYVAAFFMSVSTKNIFILIGLLAVHLCYSRSKSKLAKGHSNLIFSFMCALTSIISLVLVTKSMLYTKELKAFGALSAAQKKEITTEELADLFGNYYDRGYPEFNQGFFVLNSGNQTKGLALMKKGYTENKAPKLGKSLANAHIMYDHNYKRAEELFTFNTGNEAFRYEPRMNLLYLYERVFDTKKMDSLAKEIIAFPIKKLSTQVDEYKQYCKDLLQRAPQQQKGMDIQGNISSDYIVQSNLLNRTLKHRIYLPNINYITKSLPVVYLADGQQYVKDKSFIKTIDKLIHNQKIAPVALVFMDSSDYQDPSIDHRQEYYLCNKKYVDFVTTELIPEIEKYYPVSKERNGRSIMGYSFGGLFAAFAGMEAPDYFKNVMMQSPAYHPCPDIYTNYNIKETLDLNMYLSYGTGKDTESQDVPMINILQAKNYRLKVNREEGANHEWHVWMNQTKGIFEHYFKIN